MSIETPRGMFTTASRCGIPTDESIGMGSTVMLNAPATLEQAVGLGAHRTMGRMLHEMTPDGPPRSLPEMRMFAEWFSAGDSADYYLADFLRHWYSLGMPVFEVTGGLAAALALTECKGLFGRDLRAPFGAFAIQMPSPSPFAVKEHGDIKFFGFAMPSRPGSSGLIFVGGLDKAATGAFDMPNDDVSLDAWLRGGSDTRWQILRFLVNLCVYINSLHTLPPQDGRRKLGAHTGNRRDHEPPLPRRWVIGREIKLSNGMMQAARVAVGPDATATQRATYRMHARFTVRGHWRHQPCGKKNVERKLRWIEPYWKGPEMADGLMRLYAVKE